MVDFIPIGGRNDLTDLPDVNEYIPLGSRRELEEKLSHEEIHGDLPWWERNLIMLGRGVADLQQGMHQGNLMLTDPEAADAYTAQVNDELRLYQEGIGGQEPIASFINRAIGASAPSLVALPAGAGLAAGIGAAEGAMMFAPTGSGLEKIANTALGSLGAFLPQAGINSVRSMPQPSTPQAAQAMETAIQNNYRLRPGDVSEKPAVQFASGLADSEILGKATRQVQARKAEELAAGLRNQFDESGSLLESTARRSADDAHAENVAWTRLKAAVDNPENFDPSAVRATALDLMQQQYNRGLPNDKIIKQLKKVFKAQPVDDSFMSWKELRTQVRLNMVEWKAVDANTAPLQTIYGEITDEMKALAKRIGPEAEAAFKQANQITIDLANKGKTPVARAIAKNDETMLRKMLLGKSFLQDNPTAAGQLWASLDDEGIESAKRLLLEYAQENATDAKGVFSPKKYSQNLKGVSNRLGVFFADDPVLLQNIHDIGNMMAHVQDPNAAKGLSQLIIPGSFAAAGGTVGGMMAGTPGAAWGGIAGLASSQFAPAALTRPRGQRAMIESISKYKPGFAAWNELMAEFARLGRAIDEEKLLKTWGMDFLKSPAYLGMQLFPRATGAAIVQPEAPTDIQ
jgi:hypothetical protein